MGREQDKLEGRLREVKMPDCMERVLTSVSGGQAAASWPCIGCPPEVG